MLVVGELRSRSVACHGNRNMPFSRLFGLYAGRTVYFRRRKGGGKVVPSR